MATAVTKRNRELDNREPLIRNPKFRIGPKFVQFQTSDFGLEVSDRPIQDSKPSEAGMGLMEVMVASMIMVVSLLAVAMTMVTGISSMFTVQEQLIAKQKAREALESVFTARTTQNIQFAQIQAVGNGGIFLTGWQPIRGMGTDGIANTADEMGLAIEQLDMPGRDGMLGTGDDEHRPLTNFERQITITPVIDPNTNQIDADIVQIAVDVRYRVHGLWRTVSVSSYISRFA